MQLTPGWHEIPFGVINKKTIAINNGVGLQKEGVYKNPNKGWKIVELKKKNEN